MWLQYDLIIRWKFQFPFYSQEEISFIKYILFDQIKTATVWITTVGCNQTKRNKRQSFLLRNGYFTHLLPYLFSYLIFVFPFQELIFFQKIISSYIKINLRIKESPFTKASNANFNGTYDVFYKNGVNLTFNYET